MYNYFYHLLGTSKQLGTIIEGESLLNDGAAIVLYKIFYNLSFGAMTGMYISKNLRHLLYQSVVRLLRLFFLALFFIKWRYKSQG